MTIDDLALLDCSKLLWSVIGMNIILEASIRCRSCSPTLLEVRGPYAPDETVRCSGCGAVLTARPTFFRRVSDQDNPLLDPDRQKEIRREIETEFP